MEEEEDKDKKEEIYYNNPKLEKIDSRGSCVLRIVLVAVVILILWYLSLLFFSWAFREMWDWFVEFNIEYWGLR